MKSVIDGDGKFAFQKLGGLAPLPPEDQTSQIFNINFDGGLRLDKNPREIPINACVDMDKTRFQSGALSVGFGESALGTNFTGTVIGIVNHISRVDSVSVNRTMAFIASPGSLALVRWDKSLQSWQNEVAISLAGITETRKSMVSLQDTLIIAPADAAISNGNARYWDESGSLLSVIDPTADIQPLYVGAFGDRLILYQDLGTSTNAGEELQSLAWSVDGSILDFSAAGSGQIFLLDTPSHPIDELQGGAQIGNNILAIFRQRSIMRGFETGNIDQAVGAVHWIEGIGTESPFSITPAPIGLCFLGQDGLAYFLTEQGPTPIGEAIQDEIMSRLTVANRKQGVQASYDVANKHWWLCVPASGSSVLMTTAFIFDLGRFLLTREKIWMKLDLTNFGGSGVQSIGSTSEDL